MLINTPSKFFIVDTGGGSEFLDFVSASGDFDAHQGVHYKAGNETAAIIAEGDQGAKVILGDSGGTSNTRILEIEVDADKAIFRSLNDDLTVNQDNILILDLAASGSSSFAGGSGSSTFLNLTDTPSSYVSQALKVVRVNAGETALEFATISTGDFSNGGEAGGADRTLGNTDAFDISILANNVEVMKFETGGNVGLNNTSPFVNFVSASGDFAGHTGLHIDGTTGTGAVIVEGDTGGKLILGDSAGTVNERIAEFEVDGGSMVLRGLNDDLTTNKDSILSASLNTGKVTFGPGGVGTGGLSITLNSQDTGTAAINFTQNGTFRAQIGTELGGFPAGTAYWQVGATKIPVIIEPESGGRVIHIHTDGMIHLIEEPAHGSGYGFMVDYVQTTDATVTDLGTHAVNESEAYSVEVTVVGRTSGTGATNRAMYVLHGLFYRGLGGNVTQQGTTTVVTSIESDAAWNCTLNADTTAQTIDVRVTGTAATTIDWKSTMKVMNVTNGV